MTLQDFLPWLNIVLLIALAGGGIMAYRKGYSQESGVIQERVIDALKEEVAALRSKVDDLDKERAVQDQVIATIRYLLKSHGLRITISGDVVTLQDTSGNSKSTRVQGKAPVTPLVVNDDDTL